MTPRALVLAVLLAGCGGYPERETIRGWTLAPTSLPAPDGWEEALDSARLRAPCAVGADVWGGVASFGDWRYPTADVPTWYPGDVPRVAVAAAAGLPGLVHGACHVAQMICGVDPYLHDEPFYRCATGVP